MAKPTVLLTVFLSLSLASCAAFLYLPAPQTERSTLLLLPFTVENQQEYGGKLGFHFYYTIEKLDDSVEPLDVWFRYKMDADVVIVDSLPPGDYRVSRYGYVPAGSGDHSYGNNQAEIDIPFRLSAKSITVLQNSLNILRYNKIKGRGATTSYSIRLETTQPDQLRQIVKRLREQKHYSLWTLQNDVPQIDDGLAGRLISQPVNL